MLHIDHFGNIIISIGEFHWANEEMVSLRAPWSAEVPPLRLATRTARITLRGKTVPGIAHVYHEVAVGELLAQIDSNGFLEISVNQGDAAARLGAQLGDEVQLRV